MSQTAFPPNIRNFGEGHKVFLQYKDVDPIHNSKETVTEWEKTSNSNIKGVEAVARNPLCFPHTILWHKGVKRAIPINVPNKKGGRKYALEPFMYILEDSKGRRLICRDAHARGWPTLVSSFDNLDVGDGSPPRFATNGCWWHQVTHRDDCPIVGLVMEVLEEGKCATAISLTTGPTTYDYAAIVQVPWGKSDKTVDDKEEKTLDDKTLSDDDHKPGYYRGEPYSMALFDRLFADGTWERPRQNSNEENIRRQNSNDEDTAQLGELGELGGLRQNIKNLQEKLKASEAHVSELSVRNSKLEADLAKNNAIIELLQGQQKAADGAETNLNKLITWCENSHKEGKVVSHDIKLFMTANGLNMPGASAK